MGGEGVKQATWGNIADVVEKAFPENGEKLAAIIRTHLPDLVNRDWYRLQSEYVDVTGKVMSMHEARDKAPEDSLQQQPPWRMTEEMLLERERQGSCRPADVRAFLYHALNLNNLYSGDGYTWSLEGQRGVTEYLAANLPRFELGELGSAWAGCSLGAPTLDACMDRICRVYEKTVH